jgi:hypothetical protein
MNDLNSLIHGLNVWHEKHGHMMPVDKRELLSRAIFTLSSTKTAALGSWKCFHCAEVFTDNVAAADHFGIGQHVTPGCIERIQPGGERSILASLRRAEEALARYMTEDTDSYRHAAAMQSRHSEALRRAEELGYERGLRDAAALPASDTGVKP